MIRLLFSFVMVACLFAVGCDAGPAPPAPALFGQGDLVKVDFIPKDSGKQTANGMIIKSEYRYKYSESPKVCWCYDVMIGAHGGEEGEIWNVQESSVTLIEKNLHKPPLFEKGDTVRFITSARLGIVSMVKKDQNTKRWLYVTMYPDQDLTVYEHELKLHKRAEWEDATFKPAAESTEKEYFNEIQ